MPTRREAGGECYANILTRLGSLAGGLTETSFSTCSSFERSHDATPFIFLPKIPASTGISSGFSWRARGRGRITF
ncbi:hypothetical protein EYF80_040041 [Liparis tanakae]|uniref:Uncharacterized protein n=1 Tax=Liparis tanakae TaxID=230148 RepID=A0A4Z2G8B3_9TELE|nr:hypothetical protein EYF80_040041 [Liparis tanakae]